MQSLQAHSEEAENLLYYARKCVPNFAHDIVSNGKQNPSLNQRLAEIRREELRSKFSLADPLVEQNHIKLTDSRLIEKLVEKERLNTLIFNLYSANKGYTLSVIVRGGSNSEKPITSMRLPYTEEQLFSYIDNEEIPPLLCHMIDNCIVQLYYNGCIIAEIRDYRKSTAPNHCVKHHVLLHQSTQTIINDVNEAIDADPKFEDSFSAKLELEKTLLLANYGPLCLNPKPSIAIANHKLHYSKYFFNTHKLRYKARKHTLLGIAQHKRLEQYTKCSPSISGLMKFIDKKNTTLALKTKVPKKPLPVCPASDDFWTGAVRTVLELAKPIERPIEVKESIFQSRIIEEYIIETRDDARLQFMIKLVISQRNADFEYIGELQQSRELSTGGFHNISYNFPLGTHELASRYVLEFTNVYTERGKIRVNFTHKVPGKPPENWVTSGLRMEGNKLVPVESKSLELDTLVSLETLSSSKNDPKTRNVISAAPAKLRPTTEKFVLVTQGNSPNIMKQTAVTSDQLIPGQLQVIKDQQSLQMQIQQQLQQQILQHKRQQQNQTLQQQINASINFKAQVHEYLQMRQANVVNGVMSRNVSQYKALLHKKENVSVNAQSSQSPSTQRTVPAAISKATNPTILYQTTSNEIPATDTASTVLCNSNSITAAVNGNNSTILSLLANTSAQSAPASAATNIPLSNLLTSVAGSRTLSTGQTVNVAGQRILAKRMKIPNATAARVFSGNQQVVTSLRNATVIATNMATAGGVNVNAQPVIRLSLSSLQNQTTPVMQQKNAKSIAGRNITPGQLKTASLMNNVQPVTVTSASGLQINNSVHSISSMQSLLNNTTQMATPIRMKTNSRHNMMVGSLQSVTMNANNGQLLNDVSQTIKCTKIQTLTAASHGSLTSSTQLSSGEIQTLAGTLTAAPTISAIQVARNVQTLPAASVHLMTNSNGSNTNSQTTNVANKATPLNSIQSNTAGEEFMGKGQKIMRLSNNQETTSHISVGLPMSTLSALLSGTPISDGIVSNAKGNINLVERINASAASTSHNLASTASHDAAFNLAGATTNSIGVQNVQLSIPGMAVPITLSLSVGDQNSNNSYLDVLSQSAQTITTLSNVVGTPVILTNSNSGNIKSSTSRPTLDTSSVTNVQGNPVQQLQLISSVQRGKLNTQIAKPMTARSLLNTNRFKVTVPPPNAVVQQQPGCQGQVLSITAQQQLQLALQKQAAQLQLHQGLTAAGGLKIAQKRRKSSVATDGS